MNFFPTELSEAPADLFWVKLSQIKPSEAPVKLQRVCVECVSLKLSPLIDFHVTININKGLRLIYHNALCSRALFDLVKHSQKPVYNVVRLRSQKVDKVNGFMGLISVENFLPSIN